MFANLRSKSKRLAVNNRLIDRHIDVEVDDSSRITNIPLAHIFAQTAIWVSGQSP
jgi:hypothetical protein